MKVAIFGCLHGMLNDMFEAVAKYERDTSNHIDLILVCGDCQTIRHYDDLVCLAVPPKYRKVGDFHEYYAGKKRVPKLTIFVGGNHEASNYLMTLPYGGWVCENFYYLGYAGVIRYRGLRIAGVSGIYNFRSCNKGRYERMPLDDQSVRSIYHTRRLDVFRLQLLSKNADQKDPIDVFLSHDWPARIYDHGDLPQLLRFKPAFRSDVQSRDGLGSPMTAPLVRQLKPRRWFAAHLHCRFYAKVTHDKSTNRCTEFLSLNKIENRKRFMEVLDIEPVNRQPPQQQQQQQQQPPSQQEEQQQSQEGQQQPQQQGSTNESTATSAETDDDLYYDAEWLTILRKTINLEIRANRNVYCPRADDESGAQYYPSETEIQKTISMMESTGGLKIKRNFVMSEPVIYNRPDGSEPSLDHRRLKSFANPQHQDLCDRAELWPKDPSRHLE